MKRLNLSKNFHHDDDVPENETNTQEQLETKIIEMLKDGDSDKSIAAVIEDQFGLDWMKSQCEISSVKDMLMDDAIRGWF